MEKEWKLAVGDDKLWKMSLMSIVIFVKHLQFLENIHSVLINMIYIIACGS